MLDFASAWCDGFLTWTWSLGSALLVLVFLAAITGEASSRYAWEHVDRLDYFLGLGALSYMFLFPFHILYVLFRGLNLEMASLPWRLTIQH